MRHDSARRHRTFLALALGGALALACKPLPRGELSTGSTSAALSSEGEVHFVVRVNADALAHAEQVGISASVIDETAEALVLLPDDPELTGVSVASDVPGANLHASFPLAEILRARCDADGICEAGLTAMVVPSRDGEPPPSEIRLFAQAITEPEGEFPVAASLELEIDGEAPVVARRVGS